jgi:hypothetical protein
VISVRFFQEKYLISQQLSLIIAKAGNSSKLDGFKSSAWYPKLTIYINLCASRWILDIPTDGFK